MSEKDIKQLKENELNNVQGGFYFDRDDNDKSGTKSRKEVDDKIIDPSEIKTDTQKSF